MSTTSLSKTLMLPSKPTKANIHRGTSTLTTGSIVWEEELGATSDQLFFVTSYSDFDKLAHGPRGTTAKHPLYLYRFQPSDGSLVLLNVQGTAETVVNPAFSRYHPKLNVVYTCTEDIEENGKIFAYAVGPNGELEQLGEPVDAGGTSTCYLTLDHGAKNMLCVNYWDSTLAVFPLDTQTGAFTGPLTSMYDPKRGQKMVATGRCQGGVNHSNNDESTIRMRQADPHSHALVLDPFVGTVAYVPDLGKDLIREFLYRDGQIVMELNVLPSGLCTGHPDGPRYFEFHPKYNIAYVVNELSCTIAVFEVDRALLQEMATAKDISAYQGRSTLRLIQSIKTVPSAFPTQMNTCGRICVHRSGRFVVVSNRGHQSIAIFKVLTKGRHRGELQTVDYMHTRGETPRHFQFDASGQYLLVANQDSDSLAVFNFNLSSGALTYTGNEYGIPSPNFICCCPMRDEPSYLEESEENSPNVEQEVQLSNLQLMIENPTADSGPSSSDNSCTLQAVEQDKTTTLLAELEAARQEIAALKEQLTHDNRVE